METSVILRRLLREAAALAAVDNVTWGVTSRITRLECLRTLDRLHLRGSIGAEEFADLRNKVLRLMEKLEIVPMSDPVISLAESSFSVALGSLDSIHLSSALEWQRARGEPLILLTHDRELGLAARAQGFEVVGTTTA